MILNDSEWQWMTVNVREKTLTGKHGHPRQQHTILYNTLTKPLWLLDGLSASIHHWALYTWIEYPTPADYNHHHIVHPGLPVLAFGTLPSVWSPMYMEWIPYDPSTSHFQYVQDSSFDRVSLGNQPCFHPYPSGVQSKLIDYKTMNSNTWIGGVD